MIDLRCAMRYTCWVIKSFKHKGLAQFFVQARPAALDSAHCIDDLDIPGYRLHSLIGQQSGLWSVVVSANWRLTFAFNDGHVFKVNYEDYH